MATDFDRFLERVTSGNALQGRAPGQRFVPPPAPTPGWHAVRDDLEDTLQNLHAIRQALLDLQQSLDTVRARRTDAGAAPGPDAA